MLLTYDVLKAPSPGLDFLKTFDALSDDIYIKHKYCFRKRSFVKGILNGQLEIIPSADTSFTQDERLNKYLGGISRHYPLASPHCIHYVEGFLKINKTLICSILTHKISNIGIHQIRITAMDMNEGYPVPEGYHQDGVDFVVIIPINSKNIVGGIHSVRHGSQDGPEILGSVLNQGEALILNDKHVFHYASPIYAKYAQEEGYRDSIVVTLSS